MNRLKSQIAIVTGGAVGIGRACLERKAEEGALKAEGGEGSYRIGSPGRTYGRAGRHRLGSGLAGPGRGKVRHRGRTGGGRRHYGAMT